MRVLVVESGHGFSTKDVGDGLIAGLVSAGAEVYKYPLLYALEEMEMMTGAAKEQGVIPPGGIPDVFQLASNGIPGAAMAKQVDAVIFVHGFNVPISIPVTLRRS